MNSVDIIIGAAATGERDWLFIDGITAGTIPTAPGRSVAHGRLISGDDRPWTVTDLTLAASGGSDT